jgi:hypothetical protein
MVAAAVFVLVCFCGVLALGLMFNRTREFRAQANAGQPIVKAIEAFRKETGTYPASLTELVPKYMSAVPDMPDKANHKWRGWDFRTETNGTSVTYGLRYYMGRGGVEYEPPVWMGNDEGHRTVLLRND